MVLRCTDVKMATGLLAPLATQVTGAMNVKSVLAGGKPRELCDDLEAGSNLLESYFSLHGASVKDSHCFQGHFY
jgi:hypothetical protein